MIVVKNYIKVAKDRIKRKLISNDAGNTSGKGFVSDDIAMIQSPNSGIMGDEIIEYDDCSVSTEFGDDMNPNDTIIIDDDDSLCSVSCNDNVLPSESFNEEKHSSMTSAIEHHDVEKIIDDDDDSLCSVSINDNVLPSESFNKENHSSMTSAIEHHDVEKIIDDDDDSLCSVSINDNVLPSESFNKEKHSSMTSAIEHHDVEKIIDDDDDSLCSVSINDNVLPSESFNKEKHFSMTSAIEHHDVEKIIDDDDDSLCSISTEVGGDINQSNTDNIESFLSSKCSIKELQPSFDASANTYPEVLSASSSPSAPDSQNITTNAGYMLFRKDYLSTLEEDVKPLLEVGIKELWDNIHPDEKDDYIEEALGLIE
jgi:hypothetical protein